METPPSEPPSASADNATAPSRRKRVLFLASQPYFQWRGSPIRLGFDVRALAENGYDVDFLTLPIGEDRPVEGVRILRCPNLFFAKRIAIGPSPLKLAFDAVMFVEALGMVCRRHYDVVHGVEDCGFLAWALGRLARARVVFEKHSDAGSYKKLYAGKNNGFGQQNHWYIELVERGWFYDLVVERWNSLKEAGLFDNMLAEIDRAWEINRASFEHNFERWPIFGRRLNQEPEHVMALSSAEAHVNYLKEWLGDRILWLDETFNGQ
jgi:hypothetical protein